MLKVLPPQTYDTSYRIYRTVYKDCTVRFDCEKYFDKIMGTAEVRLSLQKGETVENILAGFDEELKEFSESRLPYLLYGSGRRP